MHNTINQIHEKIFILQYANSYTPHTIILNTIISIYVLLFVLAIYNASNDKGRLTDFISTMLINIKYGLSALMMYFIVEGTNNGTLSPEISQHIYLIFSLTNMAFIYLLYKAHLKFTFEFGHLFSCVRDVFIWHGLLHFLLWTKIYVLSMGHELVFLNQLYSLLILYFNATLALGIVLSVFKRELLSNRMIKFVIAPPTPIHLFMNK